MGELLCAVVGVAGSAFPVNIDENKSVGHLKKAVKAKNPATITCDAKYLQLFLAKMADGKWLSSCLEDVKKLKKGEKTALIEALTQEDKELQGESGLKKVLAGMLSPSTDEIHVLVVVPDGAVGSASETSATNKMIKEIHETTVLTKRKVYCHSEVGSTEYQELLDAFNITMIPVRKTGAKWGEVKGFAWDNKLSEERHKDAYREYVASNIREDLQEKKLCVFGVEPSTDILHVVVKGSNIELSGRTDLLILSDIVMESADYAYDLPEVKMLIEVKKKVERHYVFQATSKLIALDLLATDPVVALLTDFNGDWRFFWIAGKEKNNTCINRVNITDPGEAFELIRQLLNPTATTGVVIPVLQDPVKRQKLSRVMPSISEASESGGIPESVERYYDIASMLGPDNEMARAVARQVTRSIPTLSYFN